MYVAIDDTDSINANCTTFLATEIIRTLNDLDLIGFPRLIRLNPAVPWKTRGNGSLVLRFGKGKGKKTFIGMIDEKRIYCYEKESSSNLKEDEIINRLEHVIKNNCEKDSNPGLIVSKRKPSSSLYWEGVRTIMDRSVIDEELERIGAFTMEIGCGRGIIGSACGMAWRPRDRTLELLTYRPKNRWGTKREFNKSSIMNVEKKIKSTFNSWEERNQKVAMVPSTKCPIMYGLRGENLSDLMKGLEIIESEKIDRWIIFLTNQGTDDHIISNPAELIPNQSYKIKGVVASRSNHIQGGHTFLNVQTKHGEITCAAYEPSKEFRYVLDWLDIGDKITIIGEFREDPRTFNVEKLQVTQVSKKFNKISNPLCSTCGRTMKSIGKEKGYRCRICHSKCKDAAEFEAIRWIVEGWYEPPTSARRHLSKPLKRMGTEQPVEFVNGRI